MVTLKQNNAKAITIRPAIIHPIKCKLITKKNSQKKITETEGVSTVGEVVGLNRGGCLYFRLARDVSDPEHISASSKLINLTSIESESINLTTK